MTSFSVSTQSDVGCFTSFVGTKLSGVHEEGSFGFSLSAFFTSATFVITSSSVTVSATFTLKETLSDAPAATLGTVKDT